MARLGRLAWKSAPKARQRPTFRFDITTEDAGGAEIWNQEWAPHGALRGQLRKTRQGLCTGPPVRQVGKPGTAAAQSHGALRRMRLEGAGKAPSVESDMGPLTNVQALASRLRHGGNGYARRGNRRSVANTPDAHETREAMFATWRS